MASPTDGTVAGDENRLVVVEDEEGEFTCHRSEHLFLRAGGQLSLGRAPTRSPVLSRFFRKEVHGYTVIH